MKAVNVPSEVVLLTFEQALLLAAESCYVRVRQWEIDTTESGALMRARLNEAADMLRAEAATIRLNSVPRASPYDPDR